MELNDLASMSLPKLIVVSLLFVAGAVARFWSQIRALFKRKKPPPEIPPMPGMITSLLYSVGMELIIQFGDVHARKEDRMGDALLAVVNQVRQWEVPNRQLVIDFSKSHFVNSTCIAQLIKVMNDVAENNGLMLVVRYPGKIKLFRTMGEQMRLLMGHAPHIKIESVEAEL